MPSPTADFLQTGRGRDDPVVQCGAGAQERYGAVVKETQSSS
jgi:hypothetical protein